MEKPLTHYLGGYFLVEASSIQDPLLPKDYFSPSPCLSDHHPDTLSIPWVESLEQDREAYRQKWKMSPKIFDRLQSQAERWHSEKKMLWTSIFPELEYAKELYQAYFRNGPELKLFGIATSVEYLQKLHEKEQSPSTTDRSIWSFKDSIIHILKRKREVQISEGFWGYDVLGINFVEFHSFICNGLQRELSEELSIKLNSHGFIDDYAAAKEAVEFTQKPETGSDLGTWMPWAVINYPLNDWQAREAFQP